MIEESALFGQCLCFARRVLGLANSKIFLSLSWKKLQILSFIFFLVSDETSSSPRQQYARVSLWERASMPQSSAADAGTVCTEITARRSEKTTASRNASPTRRDMRLANSVLHGLSWCRTSKTLPGNHRAEQLMVMSPRRWHPDAAHALEDKLRGGRCPIEGTHHLTCGYISGRRSQQLLSTCEHAFRERINQT